MSAKRTTLVTGAVALAACAACCAPLVAPFVVPPVAAIVAAGGAGLTLAGQIGAGFVVVAGAVAFVVLRRKPVVPAPEPVAASGCGCATDAGCNTGDACELPAARS